MARLVTIHADNPPLRLLNQVLSVIQDNGLVVCPTECGYIFVADLNSKSSWERLQHLRNTDYDVSWTLVCADLKMLSQYVTLNDDCFRIIKSAEAGVFTFLLPVNKKVPNWLVPTKQKTIGVCLSQNTIVKSLLDLTRQPLLACSVFMSEVGLLTDAFDIAQQFHHHVDLVIDGGWCGMEPTTVVDLCDEPKVLRSGRGLLE